jgi:hypothetical protein
VVAAFRYAATIDGAEVAQSRSLSVDSVFTYRSVNVNTSYARVDLRHA